MSDPTSIVTISLGWVVLDRPDQSGIYIAKDLSAGWAYLIADEDGDNRHRGNGPCAGGVEVALRCAFLAAVACVPECSHIRLLVDTRVAHRVMVQLAMHDPRVVTAIGRRQVVVMTRPLERSAQLVQAAAERAASDKLRERERSEWHDIPVNAETTTEIGAPQRSSASGWRERRAALLAGTHAGTGPQAPSGRVATAASLPASSRRQGDAGATGLGRLVSPLLEGARGVIAFSGLLGGQAKPSRKAPRDSWLSDLDSQIDAVRTDLQDVGA